MNSRFTSTKTFIYALFTLAGTIIGVGFLTLPFITAKVGILTMLFYFLALGTVVLIVHLLFARVVAKTKGFHRLPGYAKIYLGKPGEIIASISSILGLTGALLAYLVVGGGFISALPLPFLGGNVLFSVLLFFSFGAVLIYFGIKPIAKVQVFAFFLFIVVLFYLLIQGLPFLEPKNLFNFQPIYLFLPYGAILFSLWGAALVPEVTEILGGKNKQEKAKKAIFWAIFLSALVYLFFIILVTGIAGELTTKDAISGLRYFFPDRVLVLIFFFGILACFTSFIALGLTLKKIFWYDFKIEKNIAWFVACFLPLFLYFLGLRDFIKIVGVVGGIMLGIEGLLIVLMSLKIKEKQGEETKSNFYSTKFFLFFLIFIFFLGIVYKIIHYIGN
jgi:amino acid permease